MTRRFWIGLATLTGSAIRGAFIGSPILLYERGFLFVGIALVVRSPWILLLTLPLAITIRYGVVAREETYLERRFGDAYRDYKGRVRRWL